MSLRKVVFVMMSLLMFSSLFFEPVKTFATTKSFSSPPQTISHSDEKERALDQSIYIDLENRTASLDREKALQGYAFTEKELQIVEDRLGSLTDEEVQLMIEEASPVSEDDVTTMVAPVIVWGGVAILGIFTGAALYFSSKYMTHVEKQNLINRCYDMGGTPSLDSGDTGGMGGAPKKAWWKISNTYTFECVK